MKTTLLATTPKPEALIERCGRLCWDSATKADGSGRFIQGLVKKGHLSVLEHASACFLLEGGLSARGLALSLRYVSPFIQISLRPGSAVVSGNFRAWLEVLQGWKLRDLDDVRRILSEVAPNCFDGTPGRRYVPNPPEHITPPGAVFWATNVEALRPHLTTKELRQHATATYYVVGSRAMSHQLVRHRCSFSQRSQRFVDEGEAQFVCPPDLTGTGRLLFRMGTALALLSYRLLRHAGAHKEDARYLLPNATVTKLAMTASIAQWKHIFAERADNKAAQWEIRAITQQIKADLLPCLEGP